LRGITDFRSQWIFKEALRMTVLGEMLMRDGIEKGIRELILDNIEEGIPETRILEKLCRRFQLDAQKAKEYYDRFSAAGEIPAETPADEN